MPNCQICNLLGVTAPTVSRWLHHYKEGSFFSNEKEKLLLAVGGQFLPIDDNLLKQKAAKALINASATNEEIAQALQISLLDVQFWRSLNEKNELAVHPFLDQSCPK